MCLYFTDIYVFPFFLVCLYFELVCLLYICIYFSNVLCYIKAHLPQVVLFPFIIASRDEAGL